MSVDIMLSRAMMDVAEERIRQKMKGYTSEHDDYYDDEELVWAASCYLMARETSFSKTWRPTGWPWHVRRWKPDTRRRNLVKACALILAEIERIDRSVSPLQKVKP